MAMQVATPPVIFSPRRRRAALARAIARQSTHGAARFVLTDMVEDVLERLEFMRAQPRRALVIGDYTGTLAPSLGGHGADVTEADARTLDEEAPIAGGPFDLVVSLVSLDRVNDLPGALIHIRHALSPGGIFIASIPGAGSLPMLRSAMLAAEPDRAAPRIHPLVDDRAATQLLQRAGFSRQVVDSRTMTVAYRSLDRLVSDLRDQALGNVLDQVGPAIGKASRERAREAFIAKADRDGRVLEKFEILTLTGWKD